MVFLQFLPNNVVGWGGGWKSINKCSNYSLTCLGSRPFHRVTFLSKLFLVSLPYLPHRTRSYRDSSENFSSDLLREFSTRNISIRKQGVCLFWKQTYCYFIIIIIIICYFNCIVFHWKGEISRVWYKPSRMGGIHAVQSFLSPGRAGFFEVLCTQPPAQASGRCEYEVLRGWALQPVAATRKIPLISVGLRLGPTWASVRVVGFGGRVRILQVVLKKLYW